MPRGNINSVTTGGTVLSRVIHCTRVRGDESRFVDFSANLRLSPRWNFRLCYFFRRNISSSERDTLAVVAARTSRRKTKLPFFVAPGDDSEAYGLVYRLVCDSGALFGSVRWTEDSFFAWYF